MFVKNINDCPEFTANDGCRIREWLHPKNDKVELPYSVATATVESGQQSYKHKLEQTEVYLITAGQGCMHVGAEEQIVNAGDAASSRLYQVIRDLPSVHSGVMCA